MKRVFENRGNRGPVSVAEVIVRMEELGATELECVELRQTVEAFCRWASRRGLVAERLAGMAEGDPGPDGG